MNHWKVLSVSLAMSLVMSQVSLANVYITPFGTTQTVQESTTETTIGNSVEQNLGAVSGGMKVGAQDGPGLENVAPGAAIQPVSSVVKPSASYSTKEPVPMAVEPEVWSAGPGTGSVLGNGSGETTASVHSETAAVEIAEPEIAAESVILYDVTHDRVLYEKNADTKRYPASITKLMTALLVLENAGLNEMVTYSETAVTKLESGAVTLSLQAGDKVSVKDSLYGLMLKSANEVANGLAEHVGGSLSGFAEMMNAKAKALGCTGTNFVNPNGLNNTEHYTTARDMAKIAKAAFENEKLCEITSTTSYRFPATKAAAARTISMGHKMIYENDSRYYSGIVGGKTGYTSLAGNTLVTCVERNGVRMIAVILKSRSSHYPDTKALFDYGYELEKASACSTVGTAMYGTNAAQVGAAAGTANNGSQIAAQTDEAAPVYHKWIADGNNWRFELADGTRLSNCFVTIDGVEYAFDTEGKMVTGWLTLGENWYFFGNSGAMIKSDWRQDGGYWFYLGTDGAMVRNAWIDNQYYVGADGVWIQ